MGGGSGILTGKPVGGGGEAILTGKPVCVWGGGGAGGGGGGSLPVGGKKREKKNSGLTQRAVQLAYMSMYEFISKTSLF